MNSRIMLVEPSATMRYVLKNYTDANGYETDGFTSFEKALNALQRQFEVFDSEYSCVLLGWPGVRDEKSDQFLQLLESTDFHDLPVIVLSQDLRADARAWVAGRNHTVLLRWKEYRNVKDLLAKQFDQDQETDHGDAFQSKFSNQDISILVVDDSPSIRYALRDLLKLQGYQVEVVGSFNEGMEAARNKQFDIAVLDYYLQDATGDELCQEIISDPDTGDVTCTILTGTYSDHIIKRSLRAGAVECMFKNESSELLLARIDAISRMVRQRKELQLNTLRMDVVIDSLNGAVLSYDNEGILRFCNSRALQMLGYAQDDEFLDHHINEVLTQHLPQANTRRPVITEFFNAERTLIPVSYTSQDLIEDGKSAGTVIRFQYNDGTTTETLDVPQDDGFGDGVLSPTRFLKELQFCIDQGGIHSPQESLSLLLIATGCKTGQHGKVPITEHQELLDNILNLLTRVYKRKNSIGYLGRGIVGIILQHKSDQQSYLLTRKLMQIINSVANSVADLSIVTNGCLIHLEKNTLLGAPQLLNKARHGLQLTESRGEDIALIFDLKRLLPVYSKK